MLFENVFQRGGLHRLIRGGCDLMLFENVFQHFWTNAGTEVVVI